MTYTALVLTDESHAKLVAAYKKAVPDDWSIVAHHMTMNMGRIKPEHEHLLGSFADLVVKEFAMDDLVAAVKVESDIPTVNAIPHVTFAVNRKAGGKPVMSNELTDWKSVEPMVLRGRIEEV